MLRLVYDNAEGDADLAYASGSLDDNDEYDLETAVLLSLHLDAPALDTDALAAGTPRRGWWADVYDDDEAGPMGSRLWLLESAAVTEPTAKRAREYAKEALKWLVDDKHVKAVDALTTVGDEAILLVPTITLKNGNTVRFSPLQVTG